MSVPYCDAIEVAALTHPGVVRETNQDAISVGGELFSGDTRGIVSRMLRAHNPVFMIADGMGGHVHGALASVAALKTVVELVREKSEVRWSSLLSEVNDALYDMMDRSPELAGYGTTIAGVQFCHERLTWFNVGDSRIYRHVHGQLVRLSKDDTPGIERPGGKRLSHIITQSLGGRLYRARIEPHVGTELALQDSETVLLCSDGLTDMVNDAAILDTLNRSGAIADAVNSLFSFALDAGGEDNISIMGIRRISERPSYGSSCTR